MHLLSENDPDTNCHAKAKRRGQRTFTLVEQDASTVKTIAHWIYLNIETCPPAKLREALEDCIAMRDFPNKKNAD
jgi:acyl-ACP thioesterase